MVDAMCSKSICLEQSVAEGGATPEAVGRDAQLLFDRIGVTRIIVVDDEYGELEVEELLGLCTELGGTQASNLRHLGDIDFQADREIWAEGVRAKWSQLDERERREVLVEARDTASATPTPRVEGEPDDAQSVDTKAAASLELILHQLEECEYLPLSLSEWRVQAEGILGDDQAESTLLLFDRDFSREEDGADNEGLSLIREVQSRGVGYCGLITHTVELEDESVECRRLAESHDLDQNRFVVVAKKRLTDDCPDYYGFLGMLRLVALSGRFLAVKSSALLVFEEASRRAESTVRALSVLDFDRIVFSSSRHEGVWEPDTLFRVFGILMRLGAQERLHRDPEVIDAFAGARRVSGIPEDLVATLGHGHPSGEALRIQRFETYDCRDQLNRFHSPVDLGDIFESPSGRRFVLLAQPCDLMVRANGKRSYEDRKQNRTATVAELVVGRERRKVSWGELPFYDESSGEPAFADFAKTHQVRLAVLDLCVLREDGNATMDLDSSCPEWLIESWRMRYSVLRNFFCKALSRYAQVDRSQREELRRLVLPAGSFTLGLGPVPRSRSVEYTLKRVMRLRQPWSGALLTAFSHFQARAAFDHPFDDRSAPQGANEDGSGETA